MKFICDVMLGKLARRLRLLGFDTVYVRDPSQLTSSEKQVDDRIFLTRRKRKTAGLHSVHLIESDKIADQLREMGNLIRSHIEPESILHRCSECNTPLRDADRAEIESLVPEFVYHHYTRFMVCPSCKRVYWEGTHVRGIEGMMEMLS